MKQVLIIIIIILSIMGCTQTAITNTNTDINIETKENPILLESLCGNSKCDEIENECICPEDCGPCKGQATKCEEYGCSEKNKCILKAIPNCCGNKICEKSLENDTTCTTDCPNCNDQKRCSTDIFDYEKQICLNKEYIPCCGNDICEPEESTESCFIDCKFKGNENDLKNYPSMFKNKNLIYVFGKKAPVTDVILITDLTSKGQLSKGMAVSDNDNVNPNSQDVIAIGNQCENSFINDLIDDDYKCGKTDVGIGIIELVPSGENTYVLILAGKGPNDREKTINVLKDYEYHRLNGTLVEVSGQINIPTIKVIKQ